MPTDKHPNAVPRAIPFKLFVLFIATFIVALTVGVYFAKSINATIAKLKPASSQVDKESDSNSEVQYYTCGMHPWVILPTPGACPICGMTLMPLDPKKFSGEVTIDPVVVQNIGVRIEPVELGPLVRTIRTVGNVDYDEKMVRDINTKISGWIEKLHVDYVGAPVKRGDVLFEIYSPDLYAAQDEYLIALKNRKQIGDSRIPDASQNAEGLVDAAKTRLLFYDVTEQQIKDLEKAGKPAKTMELRSPYQGVVIKKHANEGMKITPGMRAYRIADLSKVWVMVTLYEYQLPYVKEGQDAVMTLPYIPGQTFQGKVVYIYPYIQTRTREVKVRLEFENPYGILKPGMFANVELHNFLAENKVLVPRSAILDTGERKVAFVSLGDGKFEPRDIQMGIQTSEGRVEVLSGLKPGEMVVTSGQFLLDSEAKTREALAKMVRGTPASEQKAVAAVGGKSDLTKLPPQLASLLSETLDAYLAIGDQLANDTIKQLSSPAQTIAKAVDQMLKIKIDQQPRFWHQHEEVGVIKGKALQLAQVQKIEDARTYYSDLSVAMQTFVKATGIPPTYPAPVQKMHCPMFHGGQGGSIWLQREGDVRNPYLGQSMLSCFDKRITLPRTGGDKASAQRSKPKQSSVSKPTGTQSNLSAAARKQVDKIVTTYLKIQKALAIDKYDSFGASVKTIRQTARQLAGDSDKSLVHLADKINTATNASVTDLASAREVFSQLSTVILQLATQTPQTIQLYHVYCPMLKRIWLQTDSQIHNPYYGSSMSGCGVIKNTIPVQTVEK